MLIEEISTGKRVNVLDYNAKILISRGTWKRCNIEQPKETDVVNEVVEVVEEEKPKTKKAKK